MMVDMVAKAEIAVIATLLKNICEISERKNGETTSVRGGAGEHVYRLLFVYPLYGLVKWHAGKRYARETCDARVRYRVLRGSVLGVRGCLAYIILYLRFLFTCLLKSTLTCENIGKQGQKF